MQSRTVDDVVAELESEGHAPMIRFVSRLQREPWAEDLVFDCSLFRLWIARRGAPDVEIMVTYGDGLFGARPTHMELDAFDLTVFRPGQREDHPSIDMRVAIEKIRGWIGAA
jgi:hypothetical protein